MISFIFDSSFRKLKSMAILNDSYENCMWLKRKVTLKINDFFNKKSFY